jgi:hypothetical protein
VGVQRAPGRGPALAPRCGGSDCSVRRGRLLAGKQQPSRGLAEARPGVQRRPGEAAGVRAAHTLRLHTISPREGSGCNERRPPHTTRRGETVHTNPDDVLVLAQCIDCGLYASYASVLCPVTCGADAVTQGSSSRLQAARISPSPSLADILPTLAGPGDSEEREACRAARCPSRLCEPRGHGGFGVLVMRRRWAVGLHGGRLVFSGGGMLGHMYIRDNGDASAMSWLAMMRFGANREV